MRKWYFGKILITVILFGIIFCSSLTFPLNCDSVTENSNLDELEIISPETASMSISIKWKQTYDCAFYDVGFIDYNYDGYLDLVASIEYNVAYQRYHGLICTNGKDGSENWRTKDGSDYHERSISVCDIDKDNQQEIIIGSDDMYCFDENGVLEWSYSVASYIFSFSIVDIDKDGNLDIIVNAAEEILILSYLGSLRYSKSIDNLDYSTLAIGNLDTSGDLEIIQIISGNSTWINCYRPNLYQLWSKELVYGYDTYDIRHPVIVDIDPSPGMEIIGTTHNSILCLDSAGDFLWSKASYVYDDYIPVVADINNNGINEILISGGRSLSCIDSSGFSIWDSSLDHSMRANPVVADLDGDGTSEILVMTNPEYSGTEIENELICLNHLGELLWTFEGDFQEITWISTMDLDFDGKLEIIFVGAINANMYSSPSIIYCLEVNGIHKSGKNNWNQVNGLNYNTGNMDTDGDSIDDLTENNYGISRFTNDTDGDGISDSIELIVGLDPIVYDSTDDEDSDGLTNIEELSIYHTQMYNADSDGDGISDFDEIITYATDPMSEDTDGDELSDFDEIFIHLTDPNNHDSDYDLVPDGWELLYGFNPLLNDSYVDHDNDTLLVFDEFLAGSSPFSNDTDSDGLSDPDEYYIHGTNPSNENTDGDLMGDFWEVKYGTNPLVDDSLDDPDADFLVNYEEYNLGTDPLNRDTDGDGYGDGDEVMKGYDPLDPENYPPAPPSPSVRLGVSFFTGIFLVFLTLSLFIGVLTKRKLKE